MPLVLSLSRGAAWSDSANGDPNTVIVTLTNPGAAALTIVSLSVYEESKTGAVVGTPNYLRPNAPLGTANPVVDAGGSRSYSMECVFPVPAYSGPSPQAPGGAGGAGGPPRNPVVTLRAECLSSDGVTTTVSMPFPVLSTVAPFPVAQGGALQLTSGFNLINLVTL